MVQQRGLGVARRAQLVQIDLGESLGLDLAAARAAKIQVELVENAGAEEDVLGRRRRDAVDGEHEAIVVTLGDLEEHLGERGDTGLVGRLRLGLERDGRDGRLRVLLEDNERRRLAADAEAGAVADGNAREGLEAVLLRKAVRKRPLGLHGNDGRDNVDGRGLLRLDTVASKAQLKVARLARDGCAEVGEAGDALVVGRLRDGVGELLARVQVLGRNEEGRDLLAGARGNLGVDLLADNRVAVLVRQLDARLRLGRKGKALGRHLGHGRGDDLQLAAVDHDIVRVDLHRRRNVRVEVERDALADKLDVDKLVVGAEHGQLGKVDLAVLVRKLHRVLQLGKLLLLHIRKPEAGRAQIGNAHEPGHGRHAAVGQRLAVDVRDLDLEVVRNRLAHRHGRRLAVARKLELVHNRVHDGLERARHDLARRVVLVLDDLEVEQVAARRAVVQAEAGKRDNAAVDRLLAGRAGDEAAGTRADLGRGLADQKLALGAQRRRVRRLAVEVFELVGNHVRLENLDLDLGTFNAKALEVLHTKLGNRIKLGAHRRARRGLHKIGNLVDALETLAELGVAQHKDQHKVGHDDENERKGHRIEEAALRPVRDQIKGNDLTLGTARLVGILRLLLLRRRRIRRNGRHRLGR